MVALGDGYGYFWKMLKIFGKYSIEGVLLLTQPDMGQPGDVSLRCLLATAENRTYSNETTKQMKFQRY